MMPHSALCIKLALCKQNRSLVDTTSNVGEFEALKRNVTLYVCQHVLLCDRCLSLSISVEQKTGCAPYFNQNNQVICTAIVTRTFFFLNNSAHQQCILNSFHMTFNTQSLSIPWVGFMDKLMYLYVHNCHFDKIIVITSDANHLCSILILKALLSLRYHLDHTFIPLIAL